MNDHVISTDEWIEYQELKTLKEDAEEVVNTSMRFLNAYKGLNNVPIKLALKSAEFHLRQLEKKLRGLRCS